MHETTRIREFKSASYGMMVSTLDTVKGYNIRTTVVFGKQQ